MIKVLLFAGLQEAVKKHEISFDKSESTVNELIRQLQTEYPQIPNIDKVMVAINEEYVSNLDTIVHKGDTVALIPPVSGG